MGTTGTKYTSSVWVFFVKGPTCTKYVLYRVWGSDLWVPRVPGILLLSGCLCIGYQICPVLGCGVAIYVEHGYQVYFFCVGVFVMGTTGTNYTSSVWVF